MNQQAPNTETRQWTPAEQKMFAKKHKSYLDAAEDVNEFISFLREQYEIPEKDGWQLGEGCFVRQRVEPQVPEQASRPMPHALGTAPTKVNPKPGKSPRKRPPSQLDDHDGDYTPMVEPMPAVVTGAQGAPDIPSEEL